MKRGIGVASRSSGVGWPRMALEDAALPAIELRAQDGGTCHITVFGAKLNVSLRFKNCLF